MLFKVLYIFFALLLFSCNKKETLKISVKNVVTGEAVANMNINVYEVFNVSDGVSGTKTELFQSGETNSEGVLFLTEKFNKNRRYTVKVGKFSEEVCHINKSSYTWSVGEATDLAFEYAPCAYSKLIINNVNCSGEDDKMVLYRQDEIGSLSGVGWEHVGCVYWESPGGPDGAPAGYSRVPMGKRYYRWEVTRNGITEIFYDTIYYPAGDYVTYEINY